MRIKIRRMTNAARLLLSGANAPHEGELVYATDTKLTYIGDGTTTGGNVVNVVYGTYPGAGKPSAAPTPANPATILTNANGEVSRWNGTVWDVSENPYATVLPNTTTNRSINIGFTAEKVVTCPRAGLVLVTTRCGFSTTAIPANWNSAAYNFQAVLDATIAGRAKVGAEFGVLPPAINGPAFGRSYSLAGVFEVNAGDSVALYSYAQVSGGTGSVDIESNLQLVYIK
jgi:hypothetical protein